MPETEIPQPTYKGLEGWRQDQTEAEIRIKIVEDRDSEPRQLGIEILGLVLEEHCDYTAIMVPFGPENPTWPKLHETVTKLAALLEDRDLTDSTTQVNISRQALLIIAKDWLPEWIL